MLFHNENTNEGIESVMEEINKYVPYLVNKEVYPAIQGVAGDQLLVGRGINYLSQAANGLNLEEKKDGLHMEISDFHAQMKFLQVFQKPLL